MASVARFETEGRTIEGTSNLAVNNKLYYIRWEHMDEPTLRNGKSKKTWTEATKGEADALIEELNNAHPMLVHWLDEMWEGEMAP